MSMQFQHVTVYLHPQKLDLAVTGRGKHFICYTGMADKLSLVNPCQINSVTDGDPTPASSLKTRRH